MSMPESPITFDEIEAELKSFEAAERRRLGLEAEPVRHWHDPNPQTFTRQQRAETTILLGGLTIAQDTLLQAALEAIGYRIEVLPCPDTEALHLGKEFGNRGQCNPTYFTVGNLIKRLTALRDTERVPVAEIVQRHVFLTAGACGPCRFGTYATEYRKALRDAGFEGFRVLLFQQQGGFKQATGPEAGLELAPRFFMQVLKAVVAGDVLNALGYRIRPYELQAGDTDRAIERSKQILCEAFRDRRSILLALRRCRMEFIKVKVDRMRPKPKVMIIGEFWAMTTEGAGNYHLQRFLESEGAEVDVQPVAAWLLYMIWQNQRDTRRRLTLRGEDDAGKGLAQRDGSRLLRMLWLAERLLRGAYRAFAACIGVKHVYLPDMEQIAMAAHPYYDVELRGGEGHMEVGKLIQAVTEKKAHMVVSVKPFGCMPSSGVSDGIQSAVLSRLPDAIFCPVETTGDGGVNFQSRVLMCLFRARRRAAEELEAALQRRGLTIEEATRQIAPRDSRATEYPQHIVAGTAANQVLSLRARRQTAS
jgi:predicted nucleotide-binding protein (sugar kinase/HSP70/actin superfamily)